MKHDKYICMLVLNVAVDSETEKTDFHIDSLTLRSLFSDIGSKLLKVKGHIFQIAKKT